MEPQPQKIPDKPKVTIHPSKKAEIFNLLTQLDAVTRSKPASSAKIDSVFMEKYQDNILANLTTSSTISNVTSPEDNLLVSDFRLDAKLQHELNAKQTSFNYQNMMKIRQKLPAFQQKDQFLKLVKENQVVVVSGDTGCGKTTQSCQLILDSMITERNGSKCNIICTQPRRIAAISVAERVAEERNEPLGLSVGYSIRLESRQPSRTQGTILFCTTGVIFQMLKNDSSLSKYSYVVVDEIHERDVLSDFLLVILKDLIQTRTDLKVILMSATMNAGRFSEYFNSCPMFTIPGFTFPVKEYFLEDVLQKTQYTMDPRKNFSSQLSKAVYQSDPNYYKLFEAHLKNLQKEGSYSRQVITELIKQNSQSTKVDLDLIEALVTHICETDEDNQAILIFVSSWDQISSLHKQLEKSRFSGNFLIIPLHSKMPTVNQKEVFNKLTDGRRKIVIATNIAETSITINDIVYVIDTGTVKMTNFDLVRNIETLDTEWVSLANATQRKGRAGRVQAGICFHLFNKARQMSLEGYKKPEVLRKRLEEVVLQIKMLKLGPAGKFLARLMDPPSQHSVLLALERLIELNALDQNENLTHLGFHLAHLPMDPQIGKMVIMSTIFQCVDPILSVAASLSFKDPFYVPLGKEEDVDSIRIELSEGTHSDHMVTVNAVKGFQDVGDYVREIYYCNEYFLSANTLRLFVNMKWQFSQHLQELGFLATKNWKDEAYNVNSKNVGLVMAIICAGLYPNVAKLNMKKGKKQYTTVEDGKVLLHPKSINSKGEGCHGRYVTYFQKMKTSALYLYDTSVVSPLSLIFFGGNLIWKQEGILSVGGRAEFTVDKRTFQTILALIKYLDKLLAEKMMNPGSTTCWNVKSKKGALLQIIISLITTEYEEASSASKKFQPST